MVPGLDLCLHRSCTTSHNSRIGSADDLDDLSVEDIPVDDLAVRRVHFPTPEVRKFDNEVRNR